MSLFRIYKRGQGKYTRVITFVSVMGIVVIGTGALSETLKPHVGVYWRFGIPTAVLVALGALVFWMVNRSKSADFLIATEGEMKKVSWSSRREVVGSTKVVIVTTFMMAGILFGVDLVFQWLFSWIGIWRG